jgi:hypothetical protein
MGNGRVSLTISPHEQDFQGIAGFSGSDVFLQIKKVKNKKF